MTFHLAGEDEESYHVQHHDGSIARIPKKGSPSEVLTAVKFLPRLAEGGDVKPEDEKPAPTLLERAKALLPHRDPTGAQTSPSAVDAAETIRQHNKQLEDAANAERMADGGNVKPGPANYRENDTQERGYGLLPRSNSPIDNASENNNGWNPPAAEPKPYQGARPNQTVVVQRMAGGGEADLGPETGGEIPVDQPVPYRDPTYEEWVAQNEANLPPGSVPEVSFPAAPNSAKGPAATQPPQAAAETATSDQQQAATAQPQDQQPQQQQPGMMPFPQLPGYPGAKLQAGIDSMLSEGREGAELQRQAQEQQAQEQTKIYSDYQNGLNDIQNRWQTAHKQAADEYANAIDDVKNARIDPTHFWDSRSTGQKISATIGMILGGIGSGLTGQPNAALQVIDRAIDRDIEAQKANLGQKNNLVSMLHQKLGSIDAATNAARMYLYGDVAAKVGLAGARAGGLQAQATAKLLESHLQAQALGPMATYINGTYQAQLQRYQMEFQRRLYGMVLGNGGAQSQGYLPSLAPPPLGMDPTNPLKFHMEQQKDAAERTLPGPNGKPFLTYDAPTAQKLRPMLTAAEQVEGTIANMDRLRKGGTGIPGTMTANEYTKFRASLPEQWAMTMGLTQPSEVSNKNLEEVLPTSWDAFVRGKQTFEPIRRLLHERKTAMYQAAGLHPSAMPILQIPVR